MDLVLSAQMVRLHTVPEKGDCLIIVAFLSIENEKANIYKPKLVYVDQDNKRVDAELIDKKLVKILG